ncbi:hypothetical protein MK489_18725 [Myxococcota bacterium]|nr:hypothetical protein [Myxococcota bacterium]
MNLELQGVPTVFVATTEFTDGAEVQARALGADTAGLYVPHPIQDRTDPELQAIADAAFDELVGLLVDPGS